MEPSRTVDSKPGHSWDSGAEGDVNAVVSREFEGLAVEVVPLPEVLLLE
jgi:hypothetical protein